MEETHYLAHLLEPRSVAIIGATERPGALGAVLMRNMLEGGYTGELYAVNPKYREVFGVRCFHRIKQLPQRVDLAVIATPAETVPEIMADCGRAGVRGAVVLSAGFGESGIEGARLEAEMLRHAREYGVRLLGPNSLGMARPKVGMNATFALGGAMPGSIGFVSQSGALCAAILDWAKPNQVGFSSVISLGGSSDLDFGEILDYLAWDFRTESILLYIEGIRDARRFLSALRAAARAKPVLVIKAGRHPVGSRAVRSHTGAVAGEDQVFDAALRRAGVIRLPNLVQFFAATKALFAHFRPRGNRLAIVTNGGGPGVMAADRAADHDIPLADLGSETMAKLDGLLPHTWSRANPVDLVGDADPDRYIGALEAVLADPNVDGALAILTPQAMTQPTDVARGVLALHHRTDKPILTCFMGEDSPRQAREMFEAEAIPTFRAPETAVDLFSLISAYYRNQKLLTQAPAPLEQEQSPDLDAARALVKRVLGEGRRLLTRAEARALLSAFHIPVVLGEVALNQDEAVMHAQALGHPVAMRPNLPQSGLRKTIRARQNLASSAAVHLAFAELSEQLRVERPAALEAGISVEHIIPTTAARDLMVQVVRDTVFGPVILFSEASHAAETDREHSAVALPPLNAFLARDLMRNAPVYPRLGHWAGLPPVDLDAVERVLLGISEMVCELPWLHSVIVQPLIADIDGATVADARIELRPVPENAQLYSHMAIHPYPANLVQRWTLKDGTPVCIRPLKPEDAELEQDFMRRLSPETKYFRFMSSLRELPPAMLAKLTQIDYDRELAFVATLEREAQEFEIGVSRYAINADWKTCEFAIVVADEFQHSGVGRKLMQVLIEAACDRGLEAMKGVFLASNDRMLAFVQRLGFVLSNDPEDNSIKLGTLDLQRWRAAQPPSTHAKPS